MEVDEISNFINSEKLSYIYMPTEIVANLVLAFIIGIAISYIYKKTHKGLSYSQSFMITNIFIAVIVCMVIMIIGNNLARAFALVGALSIIRFRTVVKDTKDTSYIFWSLAAGMASGTGRYFLAIAGSVFISIIAYLLHITNFGSIYKSEFILQFRAVLKKEEKSPLYDKIISKYAKTSTLLHAEPSGDGDSIMLSFDIVMKEDKRHDEFSAYIAKLNGVSEVALIAAKYDVDY